MKNILKRYNQLHLLDYLDKINLENIDFKLMNKLYINSYEDEVLDINKISHLNVVKNVGNNYKKIGEDLILKNFYGIVIMAGGNATRLGLNKPKGMLEINCYGNNISLFQIYINKLLDIYSRYNVYINIYIMTNIENNKDIINYFELNNYFEYPKDKIKFFMQESLPLLSVDGKVLLKNNSQVFMVPNGNGFVFKSLKNSELIKDMKKNNIKYCLFTGIDNPLVNLVDFNFLGVTIFNNYKLASKTLYKTDGEDNSWVFCKYKNKPYMLDHNHLKYFKNIKDNDEEYLYRETNVMYHLIHIDYISKFSNINLKYHRAYKKYGVYIDGEYNNINCFKFEQFIYDAFYYAKDMLLYRISKDEFYPIKKKEDIVEVEKILNHNN